MFFAIELQTTGVYISPHRYGLFFPAKRFIRGRKIALRCEQVVFRCANAPYTPTTRGDTQKLVRELSRSCSLGSELSLSGRKPGRFRAAARRVIAEKRLSTVDSDPSGSRKED